MTAKHAGSVRRARRAVDLRVVFLTKNGCAPTNAQIAARAEELVQFVKEDRVLRNIRLCRSVCDAIVMLARQLPVSAQQRLSTWALPHLMWLTAYQSTPAAARDEIDRALSALLNLSKLAKQSRRK